MSTNLSCHGATQSLWGKGRWKLSTFPPDKDLYIRVDGDCGTSQWLSVCLTRRRKKMRNEVRKFFLSWLRPDVLAKEQRRSEMASAVQEHWKDNGPIHLYELIREEWDDKEEKGVDENSFYVVFIDEDIAIDWITQKKLSSEQSDAISYAESIGAKECKYLPKERQLEFRRLLGQAIVCAIDGNLEDS